MCTFLCHKKCEVSSDVKDIKIKRYHKIFCELLAVWGWLSSLEITLQGQHVADVLISIETGGIFLCHPFCFCTVLERIHVHRGLQAFAGMTLSRYKHTTVWAPVWLSSGPRSNLSKPITVTHSCNQYLIAPWQRVLVCTRARTHRAHTNATPTK